MPTYRQYLITRPGAQHIRQESDGSWVQYHTGDEISIADEHEPNDFKRWGNLGLRLLIGTPTVAPVVTKRGTAVGLAPAEQPNIKFDPRTGLDSAGAVDGANRQIAEGGNPLGVKSDVSLPASLDPPNDPVVTSAAARKADLEVLLQKGEATNGAQEFNAWRSEVVASGLLGTIDTVPTTKAGILQALAVAQAE